MTADPPLYEGIAGLALMLAPPTAGAYLALRRGWSRLDVAFALVLWGLLILLIEHANFGLREFGGADLRQHGGLHLQMLAAYGIAAFGMIALVVAPLVRRGDPVGWLGLLAVFVIGAGAEIWTALVTTPHGVPPRFWSWGLALWGYPVSWVVALALSFRPIFQSEARRSSVAVDPTVYGPTQGV